MFVFFGGFLQRTAGVFSDGQQRMNGEAGADSAAGAAVQRAAVPERLRPSETKKKKERKKLIKKNGIELGIGLESQTTKLDLSGSQLHREYHRVHLVRRLKDAGEA